MADAGGVTQAARSRRFGGSVWAKPEPPESVPSFLSFAAAALFALVATWLLFTVLLAIAYLTGILTSQGLTAEEFFARAESWVLVVILPITSAAYLAAIRGFSAWFANRLLPWSEAVVALAITALAGIALRSSSLGPGVTSALLGCVVVAGFLRWRASQRLA